jgi:hypothetical protein
MPVLLGDECAVAPPKDGHFFAVDFGFLAGGDKVLVSVAVLDFDPIADLAGRESDKTVDFLGPAFQGDPHRSIHRFSDHASENCEEIDAGRVLPTPAIGGALRASRSATVRREC